MGPRVKLKQETMSPSSDSSAVERWDHCSRCTIQSIIRFIADKLHPYKSSKKPLSRMGVHTIHLSNAALRET